MLTVVAIHGNNEILSFTYGIVDTKNLDSWSYFFRNKKIVFTEMRVHREDWTFISNRMRVCLFICTFILFALCE